MGKFEVEGYAKRKVKCDIASIRITFQAIGANAHKLSNTVMSECDDFINNLSSLSVKPENIQYESDRIEAADYHDKNNLEATRTIVIRIPFNLKLINRIQEILQKGKYNYGMYVDGDISFRHQLNAELTQEALNNSRDIAEKLAKTLEMRVIGVEAIRKDRWDDEDDQGIFSNHFSDLCGSGDILGLDIERPSDNIEAKLIEENMRIKVAWILA